MAGGLGHSAEDYYQALKKLLPPGPAWELDDDCYFMKMLRLAALEFARVDRDILTLIEESDPRTAGITLTDWFYEWLIPDECLKLLDNPTNAQYRAVLVAKIATLGYSFTQLIVRIGAALGFDVDISTHERHTVESTVDAKIYGDNWQYYALIITVDATPVTYFLADSRVDEHLASWGHQLFECLVKSLAPAHTGIIFQYGNEE